MLFIFYNILKTYAFWALGNSPNFTVGTTRLISSTEMYDQPFNWWKGEFKKLEKI